MIEPTKTIYHHRTTIKAFHSEFLGTIEILWNTNLLNGDGSVFYILEDNVKDFLLSTSIDVSINVIVDDETMHVNNKNYVHLENLLDFLKDSYESENMPNVEKIYFRVLCSYLKDFTNAF